MAKKGTRIKIGLICSICNRHNYVTKKSKINTPDPLKLQKYCLQCRKKTPHKEKKKLD